MSGPKPGSGRPSKYIYHINDKSYHSLKEAATCEGVTPKTITRWCSGGKEGCSREEAGKGLGDAESRVNEDISGYTEKAKTKPLDLWLYILDHPEQFDAKTRIQAAYYAAPYLYPKATALKGKKQERDEKAKKVGFGKFAAGPAPLKAVK